MTRDDSIRLGKAQSVARALRLEAGLAYDTGHLERAAKVFARCEIAESRAFEIEREVFRPGVELTFEDLFKSGRPML